jgi:hypothetical protein
VELTRVDWWWRRGRCGGGTPAAEAATTYAGMVETRSSSVETRLKGGAEEIGSSASPVRKKIEATLGALAVEKKKMETAEGARLLYQRGREELEGGQLPGMNGAEWQCTPVTGGDLTLARWEQGRKVMRVGRPDLNSAIFYLAKDFQTYSKLKWSKLVFWYPKILK